MIFRRATPGAPLVPFLDFCDQFGIRLYDWQREAFGAATTRADGRFRWPLGGISVPRGDGKTYGSAGVGVWRLTGWSGPCDIISSALDLEGSRVMLEHARTIVQGHDALREAVEIRANSLHVPATGSRWTITSREHTASRGRHPDLVLYDEAGWARDDELFASLLAGQASVNDPLMLVVSTVGRRQSGPLWTIKTLAEGGDERVSWWHASENRSPLVSREFLERQRRILMPAQYAREHQNQWVDAADSFATAADVDAAMAHGWTEQPNGQPRMTYAMFVDLGAVHDPTVIAIGHRDDDQVFIDRIVTFQGSKRSPVVLKAVEDEIVRLATLFNIATMRIESWQGLSAVQALQRLGLPCEVFTPTPKAHADEWPCLAQLLSTRRLVLFPHARLREELLNLVVEVGPVGVRVVDRGSVHQDHAVAVRGVCASLARALDLGPLDRWALRATTSAAPAHATLAADVYGESAGGLGLSFGRGAGAFDLGRRAFGE